MNAQQTIPVIGYSQDWGTKHVGVYEVAGPAVYATGGQTINASQLGWGGLDFVDLGGGLSYSGTYYCRVQYLPVDAAPSLQNPALKSAKLLWYVLATNAEVAAAVDLSTEIIRALMIGE